MFPTEVDRTLSAIPVDPTGTGHSAFGLRRAVDRAEHLIGEVLTRRLAPLDDVDLENVRIRAQLADGREVRALRIDCDPDGLTFAITLLAGDDR